MQQKMIKAKPCVTQETDLDEDFIKQAIKKRTKESKLPKILTSKLYLLFRFPYKFSSMSQLEKIKLDFADFGNVPKKVAIGLANGIRNLHRLKNLKITGLECSRLNDCLLLLLTEGIGKLQSLEKLHVDLKNLDHIGSTGFEGILLMLAKLQKLRKLHLDISGLTFKSELIAKLGLFIARLKKLESVHLSLPGCRSIDDDIILQIMNSLVKAKELKELCLDFLKRNRTTVASSSHIIQKISSFSKLCKLNISFSNHFSQKELFELCNEISKMSQLSTIKLDLSGCRTIEGSELSYLQKGLVALKDIKKLKINLFWGNNTILLHLSNMLMKMNRLTKLELIFQSSGQINDNGLACLNKAIYKLPELKYLGIYLNGCDQITDSGLGQLSVVISKLNQLKYLNIGLSWSHCISELGLKQLSIAISRLPSLSKMSLNLKGSRNLANEGLAKLSKSLTKMKALRYLDLNFSWCQLLTMEATEKFKNEIMKLKLDDPKVDFACI